jgi:uncharacterized protein (DUF58 family)
MEERLLEATDQELARQFRLNVRRRTAGLITGEQRSPSLGGGIEFADYREYQPGDDVRQIDWAVFLRLRKLMVKLAAEEKELTLMVLLDNSRSMNFGEADKFRLARRLTTVLCGIALETGNRAGVLCWGKDLVELVPPQRSSRPLSWFAARLAAAPTVREVDYRRCIRQFAGRYRRRCLAVLISDFLYDDWPHVLAGLSAGGNETHAIQILAPEELDPLPQGELTLVDSETDAELPLHTDAAGLGRYQAALAAFLEGVAGQCRGRGIGHVRLSSDRDLAAAFHQDLRKGGLVC